MRPLFQQLLLLKIADSANKTRSGVGLLQGGRSVETGPNQRLHAYPGVPCSRLVFNARPRFFVGIPLTRFLGRVNLSDVLSGWLLKTASRPAGELPASSVTLDRLGRLLQRHGCCCGRMDCKYQDVYSQDAPRSRSVRRSIRMWLRGRLGTGTTRQPCGATSTRGCFGLARRRTFCPILLVANQRLPSFASLAKAAGYGSPWLA